MVRSVSNPPILLRYRSANEFLLLVVALAVFTDIFLYSVIVPVLPFTLTARAGVPPGDVQRWTSILLGCYGAGVIFTAPICGYITDRTSLRRNPLLVGLIAVAAATALLCAGTNIPVLLLGRLCQGVSSAVLGIVGLALLADTFDDKRIGRVMGFVSLASNVAGLVGPLLGGIVYASGGYYAVFAMCFALLGVDVASRMLMIEKSVAAQWKVPADSTASEKQEEKLPHDTSLQLPPEVKKDPTVPPEPIQSTVIGTVKVDPGNQHPVVRSRSQLPPSITLLASRRMLVSLWGIFVLSLLRTSFDASLPLFCLRTFGWDSTGAGLIFIAFVLPSFFAPVAGSLRDRYGPRWVAMAGYTLSIPSLTLLRFVFDNTIGHKVLLCVLLGLLGLSLSLTLPCLSAEATAVIREKEKHLERPSYGQAFGLVNVAWSAGTLVGPLWGGFVSEKAGWGTMSWTLALLSAVSLVPTFLTLDGWTKERLRRAGHFTGSTSVTQAQICV